MKFIAVIDYDLIDKEFNTVCIRDKEGNLHDVDAKPLITHMIVLDDGQSVPYEEKTGHWIYRNNCWHCSECGESCKTIGYTGTAKFMNDEFKFCNHCGAKMTGGIIYE